MRLTNIAQADDPKLIQTASWGDEKILILIRILLIHVFVGRTLADVGAPRAAARTLPRPRHGAVRLRTRTFCPMTIWVLVLGLHCGSLIVLWRAIIDNNPVTMTDSRVHQLI
jgi:hypothetical protein